MRWVQFQPLHGGVLHQRRGGRQCWFEAKWRVEQGQEAGHRDGSKERSERQRGAGGSATLWLNGEVANHPSGNRVERKVANTLVLDRRGGPFGKVSRVEESAKKQQGAAYAFMTCGSGSPLGELRSNFRKPSLRDLAAGAANQIISGRWCGPPSRRCPSSRSSQPPCRGSSVQPATRCYYPATS